MQQYKVHLPYAPLITVFRLVSLSFVLYCFLSSIHKNHFINILFIMILLLWLGLSLMAFIKHWEMHRMLIDGVKISLIILMGLWMESQELSGYRCLIISIVLKIMILFCFFVNMLGHNLAMYYQHRMIYIHFFHVSYWKIVILFWIRFYQN